MATAAAPRAPDVAEDIQTINNPKDDAMFAWILDENGDVNIGEDSRQALPDTEVKCTRHATFGAFGMGL